MKFNRSYLFIVISSVALLIVLIIQVNWIFESAEMKEKLFNEKANMVLSKSLDALSSDSATINKLALCVGSSEVQKIDSLLKYYMQFYNINLSYYFEVKPGAEPVLETPKAMYSKPAIEGCYQKCLPEGAINNSAGLGLKLVFPDKDHFIWEEMGIPFLTSVLLLIVVLIISWRTTVSLINEKQISQHTTDFLNNMTHEFKTPLTNIGLAGKMIVKDSNIKQEEKIKHYSGIILDENEKLRLQVEQILSMSALERGEMPLQKAELDFHELIAEAVKCISVQIENRHGNLQLELNATRAVVPGDKTHLTNVICNLIDNAVKYSVEEPGLSIRTSDSLHSLMITVSDNGIGIDREFQKKVFEKYFRVPTGDIHDVKGFGLGLAYVKTIIELHGGTIDLRSEKGKGTTFTIKLPYA